MNDERSSTSGKETPCFKQKQTTLDTSQSKFNQYFLRELIFNVSQNGTKSVSVLYGVQNRTRSNGSNAITTTTVGLPTRCVIERYAVSPDPLLAGEIVPQVDHRWS